ncbi:MAG: phage holin family protein [Anaeroplasmataceae bacterium]|nr:phage holin family protein [Anaeroplasmataceae bacterium]
MNDILLNIISVVVTAILIPLITMLGSKLISWINSKIQNEKVASLLTQATEAVVNAVRSVFQVYVEQLKTDKTFDEQKQKTALLKAKDLVLSQMSNEVKTFIQSNYGDLQLWLTTSIEATINKLKN